MQQASDFSNILKHERRSFGGSENKQCRASRSGWKRKVPDLTNFTAHFPGGQVTTIARILSIIALYLVASNPNVSFLPFIIPAEIFK